ncbi:phytanoyl-CoA dioxygenase family protein [Phenylobacterium sp.]|uniref:phytanoyl-CoA dioxygenase family protein n=1 Tax=Phenylobacterium sp. TaxID=1871053 RepID=UPI00286B18DC|nr:phytanoyl-CoA dioxygenase family protein [Phenylobacterium sp.]
MNPTRALSPEQIEVFANEGVVTVRQAVTASDIAAMRNRLWADLERRYDLKRSDPATWAVHRVFSFQPLIKTGAFAALANPIVRDAIDQVLGDRPWEEPRHWGQPLVTFPSPPPWNLPHSEWHLDIQASASDPAVARVFTFLQPLAPRGGGTAYVAGSHQLVRALAAAEPPGAKLSSSQVRARLVAHTWFAALWTNGAPEDRQRFMSDTAIVEGVEVQVREMTGEPGDIVVMHPLMLHAFTPNVSSRPRMMLTQTIYGKR